MKAASITTEASAKCHDKFYKTGEKKQSWWYLTLERSAKLNVENEKAEKGKIFSAMVEVL